MSVRRSKRIFSQLLINSGETSDKKKRNVAGIVFMERENESPKSQSRTQQKNSSNPQSARSLTHRKSTRQKTISNASNQICVSDNTNVLDIVFIDDESDFQKEPQPKPRTKPKPKSKSQSEEFTSNKRSVAKTKQRALSTDSRCKRKPQVINLDVTYSSDSSDSDVEVVVSTPSKQRVIPKKKPCKENILWPQVEIKDNRCTLRKDSDDEEIVALESPKKKATFYPEGASILDDDNDDQDLYKVNVAEVRSKVFSALESSKFEETSSTTKVESLQKSNKGVLKFNDLGLEDPFLSDSEDKDDSGEKTKNQNGATDKPMNSFSPVIEITDVDLNSVVLSARRSNKRTSWRTKSALASLQTFAKDFDLDQSDEWQPKDDILDDDIIMAEDSKVTVRVRIGTAYERFSLMKDQKLISLFQEIADKHRSSVSRVVLSFKDSVVSIADTPKDIGLSNGDILEGGLISAENMVKGTATNSECGEDSISLKVQTSNRKVVHTIHTNKYDKFQILMDRYSKLRNIPLRKLVFKFDGEKIDPADTPLSLELEGGECIDAFEL